MVTRILLIEDDRSQARLLEKQLIRLEMEVVVVDRGEEALRCLDGGLVPDLVLLDLGLPSISGFRVCESFKTDPRTEKVPVLVITARTSVSDHSYALEAGADAFLQKPFKFKELEDQIRALLASDRRLGDRRHGEKPR